MRMRMAVCLPTPQICLPTPRIFSLGRRHVQVKCITGKTGAGNTLRALPVHQTQWLLNWRRLEGSLPTPGWGETSLKIRKMKTNENVTANGELS